MHRVVRARCGFSTASPTVLRATDASHCSWARRNGNIRSPSKSFEHRKGLHYPKKLSLLDHVHLKGSSPSGLVPYSQAEDAQEEHRSRFLSWKALPEGDRLESTLEEPKPRLLSFEAEPIFTLGRRQEDLTAEQRARLQSPLQVTLTHRRLPVANSFRPQIKKTNRGGLTTYHGPGQIVLWPIIDMHSRLYPKYGVATYANHLEITTQRLLSELFGIQTYIARDEPGVWVLGSNGQPRKIAALGVHHRRYVTALGIAVNMDMPMTGDESVNPWARFVPCGLDGKLVTSVAAEVGTDSSIGWDLEDLAGRWAALFEEGLMDESKRSENDGEAVERLRR